MSKVSSTESNRSELTIGRMVTIVGVIIMLLIHWIVGIIIIAIGGIIQYGESSQSQAHGSTKSTEHICIKCGDSRFYHYSEKDAFGRIHCKSCGYFFHPSKGSQYQVDSSSPNDTRYKPTGPPRSIGLEGCETSQRAVGMANTWFEFEAVRKAARAMAGALGQDRLSDMIRMGLDYLNANRVGAALACFYEAEQIRFSEPRLEKIRTEFGRPRTSFKVIAQKVM